MRLHPTSSPIRHIPLLPAADTKKSRPAQRTSSGEMLSFTLPGRRKSKPAIYQPAREMPPFTLPGTAERKAMFCHLSRKGIRKATGLQLSPESPSQSPSLDQSAPKSLCLARRARVSGPGRAPAGESFGEAWTAKHYS